MVSPLISIKTKQRKTFKQVSHLHGFLFEWMFFIHFCFPKQKKYNTLPYKLALKQ